MKECRAAILMELMIALAVFVLASLAVGSMLRQGVGALVRSQEQAKAADLARSTMARIEAGLARPEVLDGPVEPWQADPTVWEGDSLADPDAGLAASVGGGPGGDGGMRITGPIWMLDVVSEPSEFEGLSLVTVTASREDPENPDARSVSVTLTQLVGLRNAEPDVAGELDEMIEDLPPPPPDGVRPRNERDGSR